MIFDKKEILKKIKNTLVGKIKQLTDEALSLKDAATNEESKAENKYDTRGLEASYIAQAHAKRIEKMKESLYFIDKTQINPFKNKIKVGDLIVLLDTSNEVKSLFFLLSEGGIKVEYKSKPITSLSITSPLGSKLLGASLDDEVSINKKTYEILGVY